MRISARADYAVRATLYLARDGARSHQSAEAIAREEGIPAPFLEGILTSLRKVGIVESRRGAAGGYRLARLPGQISVADVVRAVDGPLVYVRDARPSELDYAEDKTALVSLWVALRASVRNVLEATTLDDLVFETFPPAVQVLLDDPKAWSSSSALGD